MTLTDAEQMWCDTMRQISENDRAYCAETARRGRATRATLLRGERLTRRLARAEAAWDRAAASAAPGWDRAAAQSGSATCAERKNAIKARWLARQIYTKDGTIDIEPEAPVSLSYDEPHGNPQGAYVQAWVYVDFGREIYTKDALAKKGGGR